MKRLPSEARRKSRGVTIVEILMVVGIMGLLTALLLPAVQRTRASARRMTCQDHLRQIGVALANCADAHGAFPTSNRPEAAYRRLLPYLGAGPLRDRLAAHDYPEPGAGWYVPVFLCPDDPAAHANMAVGESNFYFNAGTQFRRYDPTNGFRKSISKDTKPREISDGLSQTVAMSERLVHPWSGDYPSKTEMENEPRRYFWWTERRFSKRGEEPLAIEQCRNHRTTVFPQFYVTNILNYLTHQDYDHMLPPNHPGCNNGPEDFEVDQDLVLVPASSLHSGGVNALLGDGSVHFVSDSIDLRVWQALGTRNGQEAVANPFGG